MKVTLIKSSMSPHKVRDAMEPLEIVMLASYTPSDIEVNFYDDRIEQINFDAPTDLVAITTLTFTARRSYQIALEYKKRGVPVVMGGYHATFLPEEALQFCDSVVAGDAEKTWPELLRDFKNGKMKRLYTAKNDYPLDNIVLDRSFMADKKYTPIKLIQFGRGCRFNCDFCSIKTFYGNYLGQRPIDDVVKEIESLNSRHLFIVDDNLFSYKDKLKEFLRALIPLNVYWSSQISIDVTRDKELMALMRDSGCVSVVVGIESLNQKSLNEMKKGWNTRHGSYFEAMKVFNDHGIMIYGTFVHGFDNDTPDTLKLNLEFALRSKLFLANFNPLIPTPGAGIYDRLKKEGRLINDPWWLDPHYRWGDPPFIPKNMTVDELRDGCQQMRIEFSSISNILSRLSNYDSTMSSRYHLLGFLLTNYIYRYEVRVKHGTPLSDPEIPLTL
jgi:radical SAM superfamily enzyme YgiQ (UPF0313 family)